MNPFQFDMALQEPVFYMMRRGIRVDMEVRDRLSDEYHEEWTKFQKMLNHVAARDLNVNSPKQIKQFLYKDLNLPTRTKNKKPTTRESALRAIMAQCQEKIDTLKTDSAKRRWARGLFATKLILRIRGIRKALSSYIDINFDDDGRARCTMSVGGAETMRFSHSKTLWDTGLNLATIPKELRKMYIADDGYEISEWDLERGESWVYSFISEDPELIRIHTEGGDFHSESAAIFQDLFGGGGYSVSEIREMAKNDDHEEHELGFKLRYMGKRVNHASAYRMGAFKGAEVVNEEEDETGITVTPSQMGKAQKAWKDRYVGIQNWWDQIDKTIENTRTLVTPYGRVRQFFGWMSDHLKKEATAYVPQSTSVDYLNRGMLRVYKRLVEQGACGIELLHQNHDSILIQYPIENREEVFGLLRRELTNEPVIINGHEVTIPVEGLCGPNWYDQKEPDFV